MKQQTIDLTDFMEHAVETSSNPRIRRWGHHVVIHGDGQVRFHEAILNRLLTHENSGGRLPPDPRVLIGCPDEKTIIFQFVSLEYVESDEFKAAFRDKKVFPYKFTAKKKRGIQARDALYKSGVKQIVDTINYYKSISSKGRQYPDKLEFADPVVNAEKMTITISTDNIDNGSKKNDD